MRPSNITSELTSGAVRTRPQRKLKVGVLREMKGTQWHEPK